ncbi:MAG: hypothetical protein EXS12_07970 [Phycisphaerales bacterium]|nr:hypothetical protein [Phycisphaerales bacterium]
MPVHSALEKHQLFRESRQLMERVHCPSCRVGFAPSEVLFVAEDARLVGDPVAGPEHHLRFLPTRFDVGGAALDPEGARCTRVACPRCRIEFPRAMIELPSAVISVVGAPGSGKSYLLAAMTWGLRRERERAGACMVDTEPKLNARLHRDENILFGSPDSNEPVRLAKTEIAGDALLYRTVRVKGKDETLPLPLIFTLHVDAVSVDEQSIGADAISERFSAVGSVELPTNKLDIVEPAKRGMSLVVLYDNAGEHFLPGADESAQPVTRHLSQSRAILFVFDPTQDPRFRAAVGMSEMDGVNIRQDLMLTETFARVRHHRSHHSADDLNVPLILVLSKADAWSAGAKIDLGVEPYLPSGGLDFAVLKNMDRTLRPLLDDACPEFMTAVRAASSRVLIVPCSALGSCATSLVGARAAQSAGVRPSDIRPQWASVGLLTALPLEVDAIEIASLWT